MLASLVLAAALTGANPAYAPTQEFQFRFVYSTEAAAVDPQGVYKSLRLQARRACAINEGRNVLIRAYDEECVRRLVDDVVARIRSDDVRRVHVAATQGDASGRRIASR